MNVRRFESSIASIDHARRAWSDKNVDSNGNFISPDTVYKYMGGRYFFECNVCNHTFDMSPASIVRGSWCRYCAHRDLCDNSECKMCYDNSFASSILKDYIHEDCKVDLRKTFKAGHTLLKFRCHKCSHVFERRARGLNLTNYCQYCSKTSKILCEDQNCEICMKNSFASNTKAIFWSSKNELKPRDVHILDSKENYLFDCSKCKKLFNRTPFDIYKGLWCSHCMFWSEKEFFNKLVKLYPSLEFHFYAYWKNRIILPFDYAIHDFKVIIELDRDEIFGHEENIEYHLNKMKIANQNGYTIIRLYYLDFYHNEIEWLDLINEAIKDVIRNKPVLDEDGLLPSYFISSDPSKYDRFLDA